MPERDTTRRHAARALGTLLVCLGLLVSPAGADELRDPTKPWRAAPAPGAQTIPGFVVNAIFVSDTRRIAIVNGRRVGVGDRVDDAKVLAIADDSVTVSIRGTRVLVPLKNRRQRS